MAHRIRIQLEEQAFTAELNTSDSAALLLERLPFEAELSRWGDEYYGGTGLDIGEAPDARTEMAIGELAFWPQGGALCIFFGPTPASEGSEPRAIGPVNPIGRLLEDPAPLKKLGGSVRVQITRADE